jgi:hypothetical protein
VHFFCGRTICRPAAGPTESGPVSRTTRRRLPLDELVRWERWDA